MVCVNPDLVVHRQSGVTSPCAGLLAQRYAARGGRVIYHGKPDPAIFRRAARALGQPEDGRILVVGDSLPTDIKGAAAAGYDSLFVTRGIFAEELGIAPRRRPGPKAPRRALRPPRPDPDRRHRDVALVDAPPRGVRGCLPARRALKLLHGGRSGAAAGEQGLAGGRGGAS